MHNNSLVCFTLLTQSAIGLIWVRTLSRWVNGMRAEFFVWPLFIALALTGLGLYAGLAHLAKPRLAPHALRNLNASWLSREVLLVQAFAGIVTLLMVISLPGFSSGRVSLEVAACFLGGAALFAMIRVYLLKTVPSWNSPATPLEFTGSALLLGGTLGAVIWHFGGMNPPGWPPVLIVSGAGILTGLVLKLAAISPAMAADRAPRAHTWYAPTVATPPIGHILAIRMGLNMVGLALFLAAMNGSGPSLLWSSFSLLFIGAGEVLGRYHFYNAYRRLGL